MTDSIEENRGKSIDVIVEEVVSSLDKIKQNGPLKKGKLAWKAFDWTIKCNIVSAKVYATGGMRIAEQRNQKKSIRLWKKLKEKLQERIANLADISTRTITGYEEGLYAWLTVRNKIKDNNFGIVEMGGVSSQITFPCPSCDPMNRAVKTITLNDNSIQIYSYSFLGLGQNLAHKTLGFPPSCNYGIGSRKQGWEEKQCANQIAIQNKLAFYHPLPSQQKNLSKWYLTGSFKYMKDDDINNCCFQKGKCYKQETSCFRAIYLKKYLHVLNVPSTSYKMDVSWTKGAVICEAEGCLEKK